MALGVGEQVASFLSLPYLYFKESMFYSNTGRRGVHKPPQTDTHHSTLLQLPSASHVREYSCHKVVALIATTSTAVY